MKPYPLSPNLLPMSYSFFGFFIKNWCVSVNVGDYVIVYSDGFSSFLQDKEFISKIVNFDEKELDSFIESKSKSDYKKYGSEKTMILFEVQ